MAMGFPWCLSGSMGGSISRQFLAFYHPTPHRLPKLTRLSDGRKERVQFDKITARVSRLCYGLDPDHVDAAAITMKVIAGVYQGVTTIQLDDLVCKRSNHHHNRPILTQ